MKISYRNGFHFGFGICLNNFISVFQRKKFAHRFTKFNDHFLMTLVEKEQLSEIIMPQLRKECWLRITAQYNEEQGTNYTKSQVVNRYKNSTYQKQLRSEKLKSQENFDTYQSPEEVISNVKTEIVTEDFEIVPTDDNNEIASTGIMNVKCELKEDVTSENVEILNNSAAENLKPNEATSNDNMSLTNRGTQKFNDEDLVRLCEENNLSQKMQPQLRKQCWIDITTQYNQQHGTNFEKFQVVNRYQNYQTWLKNKSLDKRPVYKSSKPIECKVCQKVLSCSQALWRHMRSDAEHMKFIEERKSGQKDKECTCELCGKVLPNIGRLNRHKKLKHAPEGHEWEHRCDECGKTFALKTRLTSHVNQVHNDIRNSTCHVCGRAFFGQSDLRKHIECVHEGRKDHHCHICGKSFGLPNALQRHVDAHEGIKRHKCKFCDQLFGSHTGRKKHMIRMHQFFVPKRNKHWYQKTLQGKNKNLGECDS